MPISPTAVVSHHLTPRCAMASPHPELPTLLPPVAAPAGFRCQPLGDDALRPHALLAKLSWPKARHLGRCIACCARTPSRVGTMRWHTPAYRVAPPSALPVQLTTPTSMYGQNLFWHRLHTSPYRCPPSLRSALTHAHSRCPSAAVRYTPRLSHPITLALLAHTYKRCPHLSHFIHASASSLPLVSDHYRASPLFLPRRQCRAASPAFRPCVQVKELCQSSELLPELLDPHLPHRRVAAPLLRR
jgi:hypothetical protein